MDVTSGGLILKRNFVPFIREIALLSGLSLDLKTENQIILKSNKAFQTEDETSIFRYSFEAALKIPVEFKAERRFPETLAVTARSDEFTGRLIKQIASLMARYIFDEVG